MRKLLLFLSIVLCLNSCAATRLQVMSYNIRLGKANDGENSWNSRRPATVAMLNEVKPDVFGVQEAYDFQIKYITDNIPRYSCVGVGREDGKEKGEHMSVFYNSDKVELLDWGTYWLSETPEVPSFGWDAACMRTATWTKLKLKENGKEFFYVNTHLDHLGEVARRKGLALIVERIAAMNPDGIPMVLTGDFNVSPDNPCLEDLDKMMKSARKVARESDFEITYNAWGDKKTQMVIDYIYFSGFRNCPDFRALRGTYEGIPYISDHYPVTATLIF